MSNLTYLDLNFRVHKNHHFQLKYCLALFKQNKPQDTFRLSLFYHWSISQPLKTVVHLLLFSLRSSWPLQWKVAQLWHKNKTQTKKNKMAFVSFSFASDTPKLWQSDQHCRSQQRDASGGNRLKCKSACARPTVSCSAWNKQFIRPTFSLCRPFKV